MTFLFDFILDLHSTRTLTKLYCVTFGCNHDSARHRELSFFRFPVKKKTDSSEAMDLQFVWPILKSLVMKLIYFHQLMGQDPSKRRRWTMLKPGAVNANFQHVLSRRLRHNANTRSKERSGRNARRLVNSE